jgi:SMODS-associated and fused to various effectors sensor domain
VSTPRRASASGARISGDAYQHTFSWLHALRLLRPGFGISRVAFEVAGVGNLDDLVVYPQSERPRYHQLKFVATQGELLTTEWFMKVPPKRKHSPLEQFWHSFTALSAGGHPPAMALQTNRNWDGSDPLPGFLSGRQNKLVPRLAEGRERSRAGKVRRAWSNHLGIEEDELLAMLEHLALNAGRGSLEQLREECLDAQHAAGLRPDENVLDVGVAEIARMIGEGVPDVDKRRLREFVEERGLAANDSRAVVLVQALDHDPWPEAANVALDWVDRFVGDEASTRRQLHDPDDWNAVLKPQLRDAVVEIRRQGYDDVVIRGLMRLPVAFAVGHHFSDVAGFSLTTKQRGAEWSTAGEVPTTGVDRTDIDLSLGSDVAVGVSIAHDLSGEVEAYLRSAAVPASRLVHLTPTTGISHESVPDDAVARGLARQIVTEVRAAVRDVSSARVHLFLSMPYGLAVLLGHVWNRIPETTVYEDVLSGYAPAFVLG